MPSALENLLIAISRHRRAAVLFFLIAFGMVVTVTLLASKAYVSQAKMFVRLGRENVTLDPTTTFGQGPAVAIPHTREDEINGIIEVLQSRALVEKVVDIFGPEIILNQAPAEDKENGQPRAKPAQSGAQPSAERYQAILQFQRNLDVRAAKKSTVLEVSYQASSPELAQEIVTRFIEHFLELHAQLHQTPNAYRFLAEQAERARTMLTRLEKDYTELKTQTGLYSVNEERQILVSRLGKLQDEQLQAASALDVAEAEMTKLQEMASKLPPTQVTALTKAPNESVHRMRELLFSLQIKEKELLAKHAESHPDIAAIRQQARTAKEVFDKESPTLEQVTTGPNRVYEEVQVLLHKQGPVIAALRAKARSLESQLQQETVKLKELDRNALRLARLKQDIELQEAFYRKYSETQEQAQIDQALKTEKISNVRIAQPASYNPRPVRPRLLLNLAAGLLFALFGSVALAVLLGLRDRTLKTAAEVSGEVGLPVLATLPQLAEIGQAACFGKDSPVPVSPKHEL